ncbi:MAG: hypothetical protein HRT35_05690, partial [Algicola sp.]|nr:hypothetical protein [Algicola sp.]
MKIDNYLVWLRQPLKTLCLGFYLFLGGCGSTANTYTNTANSGENSHYYEQPGQSTTNACKIGGKVKRIIKVNMVAINQAFWYNRLGSAQLDGMIYALASDVVLKEKEEDKDDYTALTESKDWENGNFINLREKLMLRPDKRPRPIVLRANVGDCMDITFTNFLRGFNGLPTNTAYAGVHIEGTEMFSTAKPGENNKGIDNDGSFIGKNSNHLAGLGERKRYRLFVPQEGAFVLNSEGDNFSNNQAGQVTAGLFGALNVQPEGAEYYRSQVSEVDMTAAQQIYSDTNKNMVACEYDPTLGCSEGGQPLINYQAVYQPSSIYAGKLVLNMVRQVGNSANKIVELIYTDPTAIITGPNAGAFSADDPDPEFFQVPQTPQRTQPWREFNIMYHEPTLQKQAFAPFQGGNMANTLNAGGDFFGINYGTSAIGPEIYANRINVGPMHDCVSCVYEEFFLSSWAVGDPAMVVDIPANFTNQAVEPTPQVGTSFPKCKPVTSDSDLTNYCATNPADKGPERGPKATKAFYPDDPSNVYHSYMQDHVKMRIHHGGGTLHHLHHLHAHQWLHSPNSDNGHYLDSQLIGPGSSFTLEMVYNGSGNRNQTVGDSIFHCHFYPHFAEGMWSLWRVHDVFEKGTELVTAGNGTKAHPAGGPAVGSRALPDGEIRAGSPIPGLVPLPTRPMAPTPSELFIDDGKVVFGDLKNPDPGGMAVTQNPGYPFFIPGIAGERAPHPPLDFARLNSKTLNGGLPRHIIERSGGYVNGKYKMNVNYDPKIVEYHNRFDFSKFYDSLSGVLLAEEGTPVEKIAMDTHSVRYHASSTPSGQTADFILNGLPPQPGAPYADPCVNDFGRPVPSAANLRHYRAVDMQMDVVLNKKGWHYSQQRFAVLWEDLIPTLNKERPPEPLFFRANSGDCIEYWLANVVPEYYELDDFQVRTPTDVLGQHIHLVKFDVTSSDGSSNGYNYEDGTFSPQAVVERIKALNNGKGLAGYTEKLEAVAPTWFCDNLKGQTKKDCLKKATDPKSEWLGAQATVQRWYADPQLNNLGEDRTLRTVFTHDHFSPSTHQQAGLYMGLLVEPEGSKWKDSETGTPFYTRSDGGPTSWQAVIETPQLSDSYREFALEFQDFQLAYKKRPKNISQDVFNPYPEQNKTSFYGYSEPDYLKNIEPKLNAVSLSGAKSNSDYVDAIRKYITHDYSGYIDPGHVINPPGRNGNDTPTLISTTPPFALGTYSVNYRNEPIPYRIWDVDNQPDTKAGDLAHVFNSIKRADKDLNNQFSPYRDAARQTAPLTAGVYPFDPATPLLRAFQGDNVQVRTLVGAHINMHNFSMQGSRWMFEPSNDRSGYRSNQPMGISEHFEMLFKLAPSTMNTVKNSRNGTGGAPTKRCKKPMPSSSTFADLFYNPSSAQNGLINGNWGLVRSYLPGQDDLCLEPLPVEASVGGRQITQTGKWVCPAEAPQRSYNVVATTAEQIAYKDPNKPLPQYPGGLIYNSRGDTLDPNALLYFGCDSTANNQCKPVLPTVSSNGQQQNVLRADPFVLRAAAGECISVKLTNNFRTKARVFSTNQTLNSRNPLRQFTYGDNNNPKDMTMRPSKQAGLAPQLVSYDINESNGQNLGFNKTQTAEPGKSKTYTWYAGIIEAQNEGSYNKCDLSKQVAGVKYCYTPAEFGTTNLLTADPVEQTQFGMMAGMVIEPEGSCWFSADGTVNSGCKFTPPTFVKTAGSVLDPKSLTGTSVTVYTPPNDQYAQAPFFREFVAMAHDSLYMASSRGKKPVDDRGLYGFNYTTEPM